MNNKQLQPIAMFMICLIITLPIYVSSVYADINNVRAYGKAGVENFITQQYDLTIEADVTGNPTEYKVKLTHPKSNLATNFERCSSTGNDSSLCIVNIVYNVNSVVELCPFSDFNIEQYETVPGNLIDSKTIRIKCDAKPPIITLSVSPQSTTGEDVTLSYNIQDPKDRTTECSGIDKIEFYLNSLSSGAATIETNSSTCHYSSSTIISASSYNDGEVIIFLKAYDKLGQSSLANTSFIVDKTGPEGEAAVELTDLYGTTIQYFKPQTVLANVVLTITDLTGVSTYDLDYSQLTSSTPNCRRSGTNVVCEWRGIQLNMNEASFTRTIKLDATDTHGNTASRDVLVQAVLPQDTNPPLIIISDITIDTIDGSTVEWFKPGAMKMSFSAEISDDLAGVESISADFSGTDIITGETPVCTGNPQHYVCTWSNVRFNMKTASFSQEIKIIAKDNAGNEKTEAKTASANYRADNVPSSISNFEIVRSSGAEITDWIGDEQIPARISVDITEKGSGLNSVKGNFNSINPSYTIPIEGTCTQTSGPSPGQQQSGVYQTNINEEDLPEYEYICVWDVNIHFDTSGNPLTAQFIFNATDNSLNPSTPTFTKDFQVDIDGPVVISLTLPSSRLFDGDYYVGKDNNKFIAKITDSGIGIDKSKVYLDLTSLDISGLKQADNCSGDYCYWDISDIIYASEGTHTISISTSTTDSIGNNIEEEFELDVIVDKTPPVVDYVEVTAAKASKEVFRDLIQIGNALYIIANVTEANSLFTASADLSKFISDETEDFGDNCTRQIDDHDRETDKWICKWSTDEIDITRYKKDFIYLNFTDIAGNSEVYSHEIEVLEQIEEEVDYWKNTVRDGSPKAIDKQIITRYQPSMVFPVDLNPESNRNIWPIELFVDNCLSNVTDSAGTPTYNYLSSDAGNLPVLIDHNTDEQTGFPYKIYLNYVLEQSSPPDPSIDITCQLKIRSLVEGRRISQYEYENITVTINYYNNPLGEIEANIQEEIDSVKGGWLVKQQWLGTITSLVDKASMMCGFVMKIDAAAKTFGYLEDVIVKIPAIGPGLAIIPGKLAVSLGYLTGSWWDKVKPYCKYLNCQLYYGKDWFVTESIDEIGYMADIKRFRYKYERFFNPRDSIYLSAIYLCVPGVLYNLQKARAIDCQYIKCLKSTAVGMPIKACVSQRDYGWCSYVYGQFFNILPVAMLSQIANNIKKMLRDPSQAIAVIVKGVCNSACGVVVGADGTETWQGGIFCGACITMNSLETILDVLCDFGIGEDYCEPFWEDLEVDYSVCREVLED